MEVLAALPPWVTDRVLACGIVAGILIVLALLLTALRKVILLLLIVVVAVGLYWLAVDAKAMRRAKEELRRLKAKVSP